WRVAGVFLLGDRVAEVAEDRQRGVLEERVELGGVGDGDQEHVRLVDRLPAADRRAVETKTVVEAVEGQLVDRRGRVLPQAGEIHKSQVDELDLLLLRELEDVP